MVYAHGQGVIKQKLTLLSLLIIAGLFAFLASFGVVRGTNAASQPVNYTDVPLTASELSTKWSTDRTTPSGGYSSLASFAGRNDVLEMNIDASKQKADPFYQTEGLQRAIPSSIAVKADLFVDNSWSSAYPMRAGLWGVANDATGAISAYPIVEYTTDGYVGWRVFNMDTARTWTNLPSAPLNLNGWNKLEISYNNTTSKFDVYINNTLAISQTTEDTVDFRAVILNNKNYGLLGNNYSVHWSNFGYGNLWANPTDKNQCKGAGWQQFGFKNQGLCIQYVNTGKDSR